MSITTEPRQLMELFIKDRTGKKAKSTIYKDRDHLNQFCEWCEENQLGSVRDLDGSHFLEYKFHLQQRIADSTIRNHFSTLRTFFKFCKRIDATDQNQELHKKLETPDFDKDDLSRDDMMDFDEVKKLLQYLNKFEYATVKHAMFVVFWHTGCRRGALRGLYLDDYKPVKQREGGRYGLIQFKHRPETGTALKNKENGAVLNRHTPLDFIV